MHLSFVSIYNVQDVLGKASFIYRTSFFYKNSYGVFGVIEKKIVKSLSTIPESRRVLGFFTDPMVLTAR
jgi:hypothetical protein